MPLHIPCTKVPTRWQLTRNNPNQQGKFYIIFNSEWILFYLLCSLQIIKFHLCETCIFWGKIFSTAKFQNWRKTIHKKVIKITKHPLHRSKLIVCFLLLKIFSILNFFKWSFLITTKIWDLSLFYFIKDRVFSKTIYQILA